MALRFIDSFDHYSSADLQGSGVAQKWNYIVGNLPPAQISPTGRFNNGFRANGFNPFNNSPQLVKAFESQPTWIIGFAFRAVNLTSLGSVCILSIKDSGTNQVELLLNGDNTFSVVRNANAVTNGKSINVISANTWYYIEYLVTISSSISANQWQLNVNGANWINVATGQSSRNTANSSANQILLGPYQGYPSAPNVGSSPLTHDYDDLYICDGTGSAPLNTFLGDCRVECRLPIANSLTNTAWIPSVTPAYSCVSDPVPNGDSTYISSGNTNDISTFTLPPISSPASSIYGVQTIHASRKTDAGIRQVTDIIRSSGTNYPGPFTPNLSNSYIYFFTTYPTDPATSAPWNNTGINNMEIGVKEVT